MAQEGTERESHIEQNNPEPRTTREKTTHAKRNKKETIANKIGSPNHGDETNMTTTQQAKKDVWGKGAETKTPKNQSCNREHSHSNLTIRNQEAENPRRTQTRTLTHAGTVTPQCPQSERKQMYVFGTRGSPIALWEEIGKRTMGRNRRRILSSPRKISRLSGMSKY